MTSKQSAWIRPDFNSYYAPIIFKAIGIRGASTSLLASGIYGIVKIVTTFIFVAFGVDRYVLLVPHQRQKLIANSFGRKKPLLIGVAMMSMFLWISQSSRHMSYPG